MLVAPGLLVQVLFVLFSGVPDVSLFCESNFLPTCCWTSTSHIIFSNPNSSISGIPNSAQPSPGTARNLHLTTLSLCFNQTEQIPNCSMFESLYIFRITELLFCAYSTVTFRNKILILGDLSDNICTWHCAEFHVHTFGFSARWYQNL